MPVFEREWLTDFPFKHHLSFRSDDTCKWSLNNAIFVAVIVETISNVTFDIYIIYIYIWGAMVVVIFFKLCHFQY